MKMLITCVNHQERDVFKNNYEIHNKENNFFLFLFLSPLLLSPPIPSLSLPPVPPYLAQLSFLNEKIVGRGSLASQ